MPIDAVVQSPNPGALVTLLRVDLSAIGGQVYYLTRNAGVTYGGVAYQAVDIEFRDLTTEGGGALPTPRLRIANTDAFIQQIVNAYGDDLLGCEVRRVRTFGRFLDGQPEADPLAYFGPDVFSIERRASENPIFIDFELSAAIDQEGKMLPGRQIIRDTCTKRYRRYIQATDSFDYSKATCPYVGTNYFNVVGASTTKANDRCGRRVTDCWARFGKINAIPFGGFPGAARVRL